VLTVHNVIPHEAGGANRTVIRGNLDLANLIIAQTDHVAHELVDEIATTTPIVQIPHGPLFVDRPLPDKAEAARRLGLGPAPTVLFLGLIRAYKGVDILVDAWPEVLASVPDARLLVVGKVLDATTTAILEQLRSQPGVVAVGQYVPVAQMLDYYAVADVVVFPYHRISQSAGLMTAAGLGRPVVITPVDGLLEQVRTLTSAIVADDITGHSVAVALVASLQRTDHWQAAAAEDRRAISGSAIGWPAVASASIAAYEAHRRRPAQDPDARG
jgi:glycosyltransferase involved in cell wall biosynthesis